jgi:hypothetical protein
MFNTNTSYYGGCDCVVFTNCTNSTIVVPVNVTPSAEIPPTPPIPPSGSACNYSCDDIRQLHIVVDNLTALVTQQQNEIDMLIAQYQDLVGKAQSNNCCAKVDTINQEISDLYNIVNNITLDATQDTLNTIKTDGVRLGNNWWLGEQDKYLFAIDITSNSWYRFDPNVNRTL